MERIRLILSKIREFFRFIFFGEGIWSDVAFILFAIVVIKYIIYPLVSLALGTPYPIVTVMSRSMEHSNFNISYYLNLGFSENDIKNWPFPGGLNVGDVVIVKGVPYSEYKIGDVAVYESYFYGYPIIHRIINITVKDGKYYFTFKGDNNKRPLPNEVNIPEERVLGKAIFRIPYIGYPKVLLVSLISTIK